MKHSIVKKRPAFIPALISMFFFTSVNAQIVYTNIPDVTLKCGDIFHNCNHGYLLDLNNDGTADFRIDISTGGCYCYVCQLLSEARINPLNEGNAIMPDSSASPVKLASGSEISSSMQWSYPSGPLKSIRGCSKNSMTEAGTWKGKGYLGLRLISNNQTYFGWAQVSVSVDSKQAYLKLYDYAYQSTPRVSIIAGATNALLANSSVSNASKKDAASLNVMIVPNPVASSATISFSLDKTENASIKIFDVNGRLVKSLADAEFIVGTHQLKWDATNIGSGIYVVKMRAGNYIETKKLVVVK